MQIYSLEKKMEPFITQLFNKTIEMANYKRNRIKSLIGKYYRYDAESVFMIISAPFIRKDNKTKAIDEFKREYATNTSKFDANKWIGFDWKKIPVVMITSGNTHIGCEYCGYNIDNEEDLVACQHCPQGRFVIEYTTVESTACIAEDPVKRFRNKYPEITREEFANQLYCGLYRLVSNTSKQMNNIGNMLIKDLTDIWVGEFHSGETSCRSVSHAIKIIELLNEACQYPNHGYGDDFLVHYTEVQRDIDTEKKLDAEIKNLHKRYEDEINDPTFNVEEAHESENVDGDDDDYDIDLYLGL